jgi:hypothetical protein
MPTEPLPVAGKSVRRAVTLVIMDIEEPGLVRYWFELHLAGHAPLIEPGRIQLDGGTATFRLLGRGAGVTGYDEADCLGLLRGVLGADLPPVLRAEHNPTIDDGPAKEVANPAWRGVWVSPIEHGWTQDRVTHLRNRIAAGVRTRSGIERRAWTEMHRERERQTVAASQPRSRVTEGAGRCGGCWARSRVA